MVKQSSYFITQKLCLKLDNLLHIYNSWLHFLRQCAEIFWYVKKKGTGTWLIPFFIMLMAITLG